MALRGRPPKGTIIESDLPELLNYWNCALASPYGIYISSEKPRRLRNKLYEARREAGNGIYDEFKLSSDDGGVWITRIER
jgi:hypothetical protein